MKNTAMTRKTNASQAKHSKPAIRPGYKHTVSEGDRLAAFKSGVEKRETVTEITKTNGDNRREGERKGK